MSLPITKTVAERGVVFFKHLDINRDQMKQLALRLSTMGGAPAESTLHVHPGITSDELGTSAEPFL
jgi:hypothetical protein